MRSKRKNTYLQSDIFKIHFRSVSVQTPYPGCIKYAEIQADVNLIQFHLNKCLVTHFLNIYARWLRFMTFAFQKYAALAFQVLMGFLFLTCQNCVLKVSSVVSLIVLLWCWFWMLHWEQSENIKEIIKGVKLLLLLLLLFTSEGEMISLTDILLT